MTAAAYALPAAAGRLDEVRWIDLPSKTDSRGTLTAIEGAHDIPFAIARVYLLHGIAADRGGHAHRDTHQLVVPVTGSCEMVLSDGRESRSFRLDDVARGLLLGPMLFIALRDFSPGAQVMVLASTHYAPERSIRSWEEYLAAIGP